MKENYCRTVAERLISFWMFHRRFDANIASLARFSGVSRDTVYRWLNRKSLPKTSKAELIDEWLNTRSHPQ